MYFRDEKLWVSILINHLIGSHSLHYKDCKNALTHLHLTGMRAGNAKRPRTPVNHATFMMPARRKKRLIRMYLNSSEPFAECYYTKKVTEKISHFCFLVKQHHATWNSGFDRLLIVSILSTQSFHGDQIAYKLRWAFEKVSEQCRSKRYEEATWMCARAEDKQGRANSRPCPPEWGVGRFPRLRRPSPARSNPKFFLN